MKVFNDISEAKIIYMGTPEISAEVFSSLIEAGFHFVAAITNEDKPVGRRHDPQPTPVKKVALEHGIPVFQPHRIRLENDFLKEIPCDLILTMAYGQIVPLEVLKHPKYGCLNLHGSLLPKYRGAAPMQRAIMDGEKETGATLMEMVEEMDAGRMYAKVSFPIEESDNYESVCKKMVNAASRAAIDNILKYLNGELPGVPQDEKQVTFAAKILPEDEHLPLDLTPEKTIRYINALSPKPGAYLYLKGKKLKILSAKPYQGKGEKGEIILAKKGLAIATLSGAIEILTLQPEGKKPMGAKDFVNGTPNLLGERLD